MTGVVLGLGSNRAWNGKDCIALLRAACASLSPFLSDMRVSSIYCTAPMYVTTQDDFYNMVVCGWVADALTPHELLSHIHRIEASLGRDRSAEIRNGPRSIDIDIELYGNERVASADLVIPHPRLHERAFVLVPLLELLDGSAGAVDALGIEAATLAQLRASLCALQSADADGVRQCMTAHEFATSLCR